MAKETKFGYGFLLAGYTRYAENPSHRGHVKSKWNNHLPQVLRNGITGMWPKHPYLAFGPALGHFRTAWGREGELLLAILLLGSHRVATKYGGDSAPTESWSDGSQNCLHDMRIVGNTQLIRNG
jgi:hypothetical protein